MAIRMQLDMRQVIVFLTFQADTLEWWKDMSTRDKLATALAFTPWDNDAIDTLYQQHEADTETLNDDPCDICPREPSFNMAEFWDRHEQCTVWAHIHCALNKELPFYNRSIHGGKDEVF